MNSEETSIISNASINENKYQEEITTLRHRLEEELIEKDKILKHNVEIEEELIKNQFVNNKKMEIIMAEKKELEDKLKMQNLRKTKNVLSSIYVEDKLEENTLHVPEDSKLLSPLNAQYIKTNLKPKEVDVTETKRMAPLNSQYIEMVINKHKNNHNVKIIEPEESSLKSDNLKDAKLIKSNLQERGNHSIYSSGSSVNNWTGVYKITIDNWLNSINEMSQVYQTALEKYRERTREFNTAIFIISSLTNLVTISQFITVTPGMELSIKICIVLINFIVTTLSGILRLYEWNKKVEEYTTYLQKLDDFFASLMNELTLPPKMRKNAEEFIMQFKDKYFDVIKTAPDIDQHDYLEGLKKQNEFIEQKTENLSAKKRQRIQDLV